jgi:magnesium transporter
MIRAWHADPGGAREVAADQVLGRLEGGPGAVWIDFDAEDQNAARELLAPLHIHPLAIEDMFLEINRPKVDDYGTYLYLVVHSARWEPGKRPTLREIDVVVGERFIVTYHDGPTRSIASAFDVLARRPELLGRGPVPLLHFVLDLLVDHYLPIMDQVAEEIDALEEQVFRRTTQREQVRILRLKRGMAALRRIVGPQRDTILALTRDEFRAIPAEMRPYLRDVYDRLARVGDLLDSFRDEVAGLLDLHVSLASNRLNEVIKTLTVIATIMLPLSLVTSYYGMNFSFAVYRWKHGELYVLGVLALTALATWAYLRRRRWL